jgi:H+/Cl- antiporter ClcA
LNTELFCFGLAYYLLALFSAGSWIAAGLLVPQLIIGAAIGRFYGWILFQMGIPSIDPGIYALLGSR